jgi:hypothetical protein
LRAGDRNVERQVDAHVTLSTRLMETLYSAGLFDAAE